MNIGRKLIRSCSVATLATAFLVSVETPLLANAQQAQSSDASQPAANSLPDAPQPQGAPDQQAQTPANQQPPAGAAGAKAANTKGAPVAQPAGAAVAPARQRGHRSLLIKLGLLAGASVAVGSAVALSHGSPSRPPGASSSAARQ